MRQTKDFDEGFSLTMIYEIGPFFDANDPATKAGLIDTRENRRKTGYVDHPADPGGVTKFGIAQNFVTDLDVKKITLDQAKTVYEKRYWVANNCQVLPYPLNVLHFDACVNHGGKAAAKFLQRALGVPVDGNVGPITLAKVKDFDAFELCDKALKAREAFYFRLVELKPTSKVFLKGWLARISGLSAYIDVSKKLMK